MWMPSLDLAGGLWARARRTLYTFFSRLSRYAQRFWLSRAYFPVLLTVAGAFMAAGQPVYGVVALGCIVIWLLAAMFEENFATKYPNIAQHIVDAGPHAKH